MQLGIILSNSVHGTQYGEHSQKDGGGEGFVTRGFLAVISCFYGQVRLRSSISIDKVFRDFYPLVRSFRETPRGFVSQHPQLSCIQSISLANGKSCLNPFNCKWHRMIHISGIQLFPHLIPSLQIINCPYHLFGGFLQCFGRGREIF